MTNPLYVDDPDFYERPGETVHLITDVNPPKITVPALPWQEQPTPPTRVGHMQALGMAGDDDGVTPRCVVCGRKASHHSLLCEYCARAQQRDETAKARARQPQPSTPRIHSSREGWERYRDEQSYRTPEPDGPAIGEHETRIG